VSDDQAAQTTPWDAAIASAAQPDTAFRQVGRSLAEQIAANGPEATASVDVHGGLRLRAAPGRCAHAGSGIGCALAIVSAATALTSLLSSAAAQDGRLCELLDEKIIPSPARWGR
jgi:hypothetical protein